MWAGGGYQIRRREKAASRFLGGRSLSGGSTRRWGTADIVENNLGW
jgi:hypothetical protein